MLRVGLTGGLGSGKSTAARIFAALGAHILEADSIGRELMRPGEPVHAAIVSRFGSEFVLADGGLDRKALAARVFSNPGELAALNAIVHPAVIARQAELAADIARHEPEAIVIVESALLFETVHSGEGGWRHRFDRIILVTAPEELRIARFVARSAAGRSLFPEQILALEDEARRRIASQAPEQEKAAGSDYILTNSGPVTELEWQADRLWPILESAARQPRSS